LSRTVVARIIGRLSLHNVLPQELGNLLSMCDLLGDVVAAGLQVAVGLEVLADFGAGGD
jgi:hypothetical protein